MPATPNGRNKQGRDESAAGTESDDSLLGRLQRAVDRHGGVKLVLLPISAVATVGGALSALGNNWLLLGLIVGAGVAITLAVLLVLEHRTVDVQRQRLQGLQRELANIKGQLGAHGRRLAAHGSELDDLRQRTMQVNWAVQRVGACGACQAG